MRGRFLLGCDIGGTFTDFVLLDRESDELHLVKCPTTTEDPSNGVMDGVAAYETLFPEVLAETERVHHGTTLVINAVIERSGAKTGLIATKGFRDVIEIGSERRYDVYDLQQQYPRPLVPRHLRFGLTERIRSDGKVLTPIDLRELEEIARHLADAGVESVAVCLLHAYRDATHEDQVEERLAALLPGVELSISAKVLPEINEYARASTTVVNAYTKPLMRRYLERLERLFAEKGFGGQVLIMLSSGGATSIDTAVRFPVRVIESGPVGGVTLCQHIKSRLDLGGAIAFDMGGTTAKVCLLQGDEVPRANDYEVARVHRFKRGSGIPIKASCVDLLEIGTGGGSIAGIGPLGLLQVGPHSAGATPGPACYGHGGTQPTTTDADLLLGYLDPMYFLGGSMPLDLEASREALRAHVADPLGLTPELAAWGIHDLANESMAAATRVFAAERGADPTKMTLIATGGAGPVHARGFAAKLGVRRVVIPPAAGVASAVGFLAAPISFDLVQTYKRPLSEADLSYLETRFEEQRREITKTLEAAGGEAARFDRSVDVRYIGQGHEIRVALPDEPLVELGRARLLELFQRTYERLYGSALSGNEFEIVNLRLTGRGPETASPLRPRPASSDPLVKGQRPAFCPNEQDFVRHSVVDRYAIAPGVRIEGPAIIEERESTTIVDARMTAEVDELGLLHLHFAS